MNYKLEDFGAEAKRIRQSLKLRQADVRDLVGLNQDTLRRTEKGLTMPTIETLDLLSIAYHTDMNQVFNAYKVTFDKYLEDRMKTVLPKIRKMDFGHLKEEIDLFEKEFENTFKGSSQIIEDKKNQYLEYLTSMSNIENAFSDKSRNDLTRLLKVSRYDLAYIKKHPKQLLLDKLEIRIFVLISIIYRYRDEFENSLAVIKAAKYAIDERYKNDHDYLYFSYLVSLNLMTIHHRQDNFSLLDEEYKHLLGLLDDQVGIATLTGMFIRSAINKHFLSESGTKALVEASLILLNDSGYENKAERTGQMLRNRYDFLD